MGKLEPNKEVERRRLEEEADRLLAEDLGELTQELYSKKKEDEDLETELSIVKKKPKQGLPVDLHADIGDLDVFHGPPIPFQGQTVPTHQVWIAAVLWDSRLRRNTISQPTSFPTAVYSVQQDNYDKTKDGEAQFTGYIAYTRKDCGFTPEDPVIIRPKQSTDYALFNCFADRDGKEIDAFVLDNEGISYRKQHWLMAIPSESITPEIKKGDIKDLGMVKHPEYSPWDTVEMNLIYVPTQRVRAIHEQVLKDVKKRGLI
jgi:hypothetical protein